MNGLSSQSPQSSAGRSEGASAQVQPDPAAPTQLGGNDRPEATDQARKGEERSQASVAHESADATLLEQLRSGQSEALKRLIDRYDPVVRYAIFRTGRRQCLADPEWLDMVASDVWMGLQDSLARAGTVPASLRAYLAQIARNRAVSAIRREARSRKHESPLDGGDERLAGVPSDPSDEPSNIMAQMEELSALKQCLDTLNEEDRKLVSQLGAITERRWLEAGEALGMAESTLRSRWKNVLKRLEACVAGRLGKNVAPGGEMGDSE